MNGPVYSRLPDVVWRLGPDRVLVHPVDALPEQAVMELIGPVALVWVALDEPCAVDELVDRLVDAGLEPAGLDADLDRLVDAGLVSRTGS